MKTILTRNMYQKGGKRNNTGRSMKFSIQTTVAKCIKKRQHNTTQIHLMQKFSAQIETDQDTQFISFQVSFLKFAIQESQFFLMQSDLYWIAKFDCL